MMRRSTVQFGQTTHYMASILTLGKYWILKIEINHFKCIFPYWFQLFLLGTRTLLGPHSGNFKLILYMCFAELWQNISLYKRCPRNALLVLAFSKMNENIDTWWQSNIIIVELTPHITRDSSPGPPALEWMISTPRLYPHRISISYKFIEKYLVTE